MRSVVVARGPQTAINAVQEGLHLRHARRNGILCDRRDGRRLAETAVPARRHAVVGRGLIEERLQLERLPGGVASLCAAVGKGGRALRSDVDGLVGVIGAGGGRGGDDAVGGAENTMC